MAREAEEPDVPDDREEDGDQPGPDGPPLREHDQPAEERVAARWTASGTHNGPWGEAAPTGRHAEFSGVNIFRFDPTGKVIEIWNHRDDLGLREQLGAAIYAGAPSDPQT